MSLLFNMLSRLVITFLPRNKCLLISWLQSPSAVSLRTAKSLQSYPTLCDPMDGSPPGSPVPVILQARTLEWVAISFFNAWKWKVKVKSLSHVWLVATPWTAAYQAPLSMGVSRQEYWSGGARALEWGAIAFATKRHIQSQFILAWRAIWRLYIFPNILQKI